MSVEIDVRTNLKQLERNLDDFAYRQLPFATAQALTGLGKLVQAGEREAMSSVFDKPTPFTVNAVGVQGARKDNLQAVVYVKDIAASYLAPYEFGGPNKLNSTALLKPVSQPVNQYGNLPRTKTSQLKARADVFVGKVKGKNGEEIEGIWQRTKASKGKPSSLKLLIRFSDAHPAKQHLDFRKRAEQLVRANFNAEMGKALARAIATAR